MAKAKAYVLMAVTTSPIAFNVPYPVAVYATPEEANCACAERRKKAQRLDYYVRSAELVPEAGQGGGE